MKPVGLTLFTAVLLTPLIPAANAQEPGAPPPRGYSIPTIDLSGDSHRQTVVDREPGQYLGHPTTVLLEDGQTILCVYPKGHGRGVIVYKRSNDGGLTWSERLPTPESWATSNEVPTIHRVVDAGGKKRLILWSGLYPARLVDNHRGADCAYPGVEIQPDGTIVTTTYGHWSAGQSPYIVSVRLQAEELDAKARSRQK